MAPSPPPRRCAPSALAAARQPRGPGVRLEWPGRRWRTGDKACALQSGARTGTRLFDDVTPARGRTGRSEARILHGDVLDLTRTLALEGHRGAVDLVRALLDEVLGREPFLNETVRRRAPNFGRQAPRTSP